MAGKPRDPNKVYAPWISRRKLGVPNSKHKCECGKCKCCRNRRDVNNYNVRKRLGHILYKKNVEIPDIEPIEDFKTKPNGKIKHYEWDRN